MANNNQIYKMSNAGGFKSLTRYHDMLAGNTTWVSWEPDGAFDSLATVTVPSGGLASVTFASIPNTYKHLQVRSYSLNNAGANGYYCQFRVGNGSVDSGSNYSWHHLVGNGAGTSAAGYASQNYARLFGTVSGPTNNSSGFAVVADFLDYANTNKFKTVRSLEGADGNGVGEVGLISSLWQSTSAINTITLSAFSQGSASTFGQHSQFTLYGVK
jgi:hypothetical protein